MQTVTLLNQRLNKIGGLVLGVTILYKYHKWGLIKYWLQKQQGILCPLLQVKQMFWCFLLLKNLSTVIFRCLPAKGYPLQKEQKLQNCKLVVDQCRYRSVLRTVQAFGNHFCWTFLSVLLHTISRHMEKPPSLRLCLSSSPASPKAAQNNSRNK